MANKIFQNVIIQMKDALDRTVGVVDERGYVLASNDLTLIGSRLDGFNLVSFSEGKMMVQSGGRTFRLLTNDSTRYDFIAFVEGEDSGSVMLATVIAVAFNESKLNYDEKHNKAAFVKNIISDNILPGDVYVRAKELHFATDDPRCVILVRQINNHEITAVENVQRMFPDKQSDFVLSINERDIVVVKLLQSDEDLSEAVSAAQLIEKRMKEELGTICNIGISTPASHLRELADKYKEAQVAIEVGNIFESDKTIVKYDSLGLGRIIYQLPTRLCEMFLNEVFKRNPIETLDEDTLDTINKFFENNLNVSETSRRLYVHRNTLVYRLEKIKKLTGLDLREFDHAIVFKVAMMVKMYLDSLNKPRY